MSDAYFRSLVPVVEHDGRNGFILGDFYTAVLKIDNEEDARKFFDSYEAFVEASPKPEGLDSKGRPYKTRTSREVAAANIGWVFGEGMTPERVAMWAAATPAAHPAFGTTMPTPEKALAIGIAEGQRQKKANQRDPSDSSS